MLKKPLHRDDAANLFRYLKDLTYARATVNCVDDRQGLAKLYVLIALVGFSLNKGGVVSGVMAFSPCMWCDQEFAGGTILTIHYR